MRKNRAENMSGGWGSYAAAVICAGAMWGFMGFFTRNLALVGVSTTGAIFIRLAPSVLGFAAVMLIKDPKGFSFEPRDFWIFAGGGLFSLLLLTYCYFKAIEMMSLSAAAILLYTAPSIVVILSRFIFRERITGIKTAALLLAFTGCCLVAGISYGGIELSPAGLLYGLGAGTGYGLYSIFAKLALNRGYRSTTFNFYSCLLAGLGAAAVWGVSGPLTAMFSSLPALIWCLAAAAVTCFLPYTLYTFSLNGLEAGRASILASVEPVVATLVGVLVFGENMSPEGAAGVLCVIAAVVLLNIKLKK